MPELPEVETLRRELARELVGQKILGVEVRLAKVFRPAEGLGASDLVGRAIEEAYRYGKYLVLPLTGGLSLVFHLRLAGQLAVIRDGQVVVAGGHPVPAFGASLPHRSTHMIFSLSNGSILYFTDIRQFGFCLLLLTADVPSYIAARRLGPDAVGDELTDGELARVLGRRPRANLKSLLLDQRAISGLGNIYADESLWLARLNPLRTAASLSLEETSRLRAGIQDALNYALTSGVAHVLNGRALPGRDFPRAHGHAGDPCPRCAETIVRIRIGGRSTYYCPTCQPEPVTLAVE